MDIRALDESLIIDQIRKKAPDLFSQDSETQNQQMSFDLTESENNMEQRLQPFIQPIRASVTPLRKKRQEHYLSPYSQKMLKERMSTSGSYHGRQGSSIRKKIFSIHGQDRKIEEEKAKLKQETENKKYKGVQPKYMEKRPLMRNAEQIERNIYGRLKTQAEHLKRQRSVSQEQNQLKWSSFIQKNNQWQQARQNNRIKAKISQSMKVIEQQNSRPPPRPAPEATVDQCLQKLRRQAQKLKQRLNLYTFQPILYETERNKRKLSKSKEKQSQRQLQKQKQRQQQTGRFSKIQPKQLKQRKFTVIANPKKQLQFIFKK